MKCGARVALGIAGGYLLGRTKKMKLALMVGGLAAGRKAGGPGQLLAQGTKLLGQSPELGRLTEEVRGRLLDAGKAAAVAVATRQVEALTERVVGRVGGLTEAGGRTVSDVGDTVGGVGRSVADLGRQTGGEPGQDDDRYDDATDDADAAETAGDGEAAFDEEPVDEDGNAESLDEQAEEPPVEPAPRRRAPGTAANARRAGAAAVTRAAAAAGTGKASGRRRSGRPARTRQGGTDD